MVLSFPNKVGGELQLMKRLTQINMAYNTPSVWSVRSYLTSQVAAPPPPKTPYRYFGPSSKMWTHAGFGSSSSSFSSSETGTDIVPFRRSDLTYIDDSPSFCRSSRYSPGTSGRMCAKG